MTVQIEMNRERLGKSTKGKHPEIYECTDDNEEIEYLEGQEDVASVAPEEGGLERITVSLIGDVELKREEVERFRTYLQYGLPHYFTKGDILAFPNAPNPTLSESLQENGTPVYERRPLLYSLHSYVEGRMEDVGSAELRWRERDFTGKKARCYNYELEFVFQGTALYSFVAERIRELGKVFNGEDTKREFLDTWASPL